MKILIELPTWLGDAVMATPALENLFAAYPEAEITIVGSYVSTEALKVHPRINRVVIDKTKSGGFRPLNIYRLSKELQKHDLALSFRSHFYSKLLLLLTGTPKRYIYKKTSIDHRLSTIDSAQSAAHQVQRYQSFINGITGRNDLPGPLKLYWPAKSFERQTLGINPGATYGSAKRWYPEKFAEVAAELSDRFDILIFGGPGERKIAADIERAVHEKGVEKVKNIAGETTIPELCSLIGGLDLFITGDSGPMHIAAAYSVPTVAVFGPTRHKETCQWMNQKSVIVRHDLECAPCMKRTCPIKTHECMKGIEASEVTEAANRLLESM
ncbi:ADP-heptose--lipooligosaccharide heptosyltransferase II [Hydrogenimonas sp.]|nr:ADP-heptose--lipooligosaccharide heptosyltransferase II [Hydrogenimonas sp.]